LTTAVSEGAKGRGYGKAGGEGLFSWCKIGESLTQLRGPPFPVSGVRAVIN
jgi:hypothetical protein